MYRVEHSERYVPEIAVTEYDSMEEIQKRYFVYPELIAFYVVGMQVGMYEEFEYDAYISLKIKKMS